MDSKRKLKLGDVLILNNVINENDLEKALALQKGTWKKLGEVLVDQGIVTEEQIASSLSIQLGLELVQLNNIVVPPEVLQLVPVSVLKKNKVFPISFAPNNINILQVAMADPMDMNAMDDISIITNCQVEPVVATSREVLLAIDKFYRHDDVSSALEAYAKEKNLGVEDVDLISDEVSDSPIVMLVKEIIEKAVRQRVSDIHIEPTERTVRIRYRIDGALYERGSYDINVLPAIVARIKIIGGMDIAEKRKPQDGRISQVVERMEFEIRVSILPTVYGEKVVMRLTSKTALTRETSKLGFRKEELEAFNYMLKNPNGIILVTGPTGSGKSTTLYTALSELNTEDVNIITVEDPVEANLDGINQVQVNPKADLTFASALRSILRQDPDIIMVGEIRDKETATIAVQASITGHLVVSTLHTNSAVGTISRLEDMGIDPYLIADAVVGVIAQRLVRRLCPECKRKREATLEEKGFMNCPIEGEVYIYEACGCPSCDQTGYKGRIGVYEIMRVTPEIKHAISKQEGVISIKEKALAGGMNTLRMSAIKSVLEGTTSYDEMIKVSFDV